MTPEQLELAARRFCQITGVDPEQLIADPRNETTMYIQTPRWKVMASEFEMYNAIFECIEFAKKEKQ